MQSIDQAPATASVKVPRVVAQRAVSARRRQWPLRTAAGLLFGLAASAFGLAGPAGSLHAAMPRISFSAGSLEYAEQRLEGVRAGLEPDGSFRVTFAGMRGAAEAYFGQGLSVEGALEEVTREDDALALRASVSAHGLRSSLLLWSGADIMRLELEVEDQPVTALADVPGLPPAADWFSRGRFDAMLDVVQAGDRPLDVSGRLDGRDLSFDSPDGQYAGDGLAMTVRGKLDFADAPGFDLQGSVAGGELLLGDFYRDFSDAALNFKAAGEWAESGLELGRIRLDDGGALAVEAAARIGQGEGAEDWSLQVSSLELAFPGAYRRYLEPVAAAWTLDGLELTGTVSWSGQWRGRFAGVRRP
jgi:hypothetical protein